MSTSLAKLFCPFMTLGAYNPDNYNGSYNLTNNNKDKDNFYTTFINSCLLADNHDQKKINLSFLGCEYPDIIKFSWSWQLDLLDLKPVCIIKAISLAAALFWDPIFASYPCHTMKLVFKLGLRTNKIKSDIVKDGIKTV